MDDKLKHLLQTQVESEAGRGPRDVGAAMDRGRRKKTVARFGVGSGVILLVAAIAWTAVARPFADNTSPDVVGPGPSEHQDGALYEEVSEQTRAEVFAFRALAATGLMDPYGARTYNWTYEEDTTETEGSWRVGFAASDCEPKGTTQTCTGLSGEDPELGNALTDTYVTVALQDDEWQVLYVEGNMPAEDVRRLEGFSLPDAPEPSHWDFASVAVLDSGVEDLGFAMTPIWVGPYPTEAPGSVCSIQGVDAQRDPVGKASKEYVEPPNREFERGGWVRSGGVDLPPEAVDAVVTCEQYTGPGWEVAGEPEMQGAPGKVMGVSIPLEWHGPEEFVAPASCDATLVDESGDVVWAGTERLEGMWPPPKAKDYPYRSAVFIHTGGEPIDAQEVGDFSCRTL